jgi:transcriptional regulator with XRE-family HTH domain
MTDGLGERLRKLRLEAGETQVGLAKAIGVTQVLVTNVERGISKSTRYAPQLAAHYNVSALWLATGQGSRDDQDDPEAQEILADIMGLEPRDKEIIRNLLIRMNNPQK